MSHLSLMYTHICTRIHTSHIPIHIHTGQLPVVGILAPDLCGWKTKGDGIKYWGPLLNAHPPRQVDDERSIRVCVCVCVCGRGPSVKRRSTQVDDECVCVCVCVV